MYGQGKVLEPRNKSTLVVLIVARISGCANQKELSLDDQRDHGTAIVKEMYSGLVEYRLISTKGKGERLDRPELAEVEAELRKGDVDLLIIEDLGRLVRGIHASWLLGIAVDHGTRGISPNDGVDTWEPTWEEDAIAACRDHVAHNAHTSKRLKQKLMNRFLKFGGATALPIAGYIVPEGARTYHEWRKDEALTHWIQAGLRILRETQSGEAVAAYFNRVGMPVGPYCRKSKWDGRMARRFLRNRLLGGMPGRGFKHTEKHHESGRRVSVKKPDGPQFVEYPHLAHVSIDELDATNAEVDAAHKRLGSPGTRVHGVGVRRFSPYPGGGGATCWYCGRPYVWGGNGITENLMCNGSRERSCWNSFGINGALVTQRVRDAILRELDSLGGLEETYRQMVADARQLQGEGLPSQLEKLKQEEDRLTLQKRNVGNAIATAGINELLQEKMAELTAEEKRLTRQRRELERVSSQKLQVPSSVADLRKQIADIFMEYAHTSAEFGVVLKKLVPHCQIYLVRSVGGGHPLPRARVVLNLDGFVPDAHRVPGLSEVLSRSVTLDLFEAPPQREAVLAEAVTLTAQGLDQRAVARALQITQPAVGKALQLNQMMIDAGLSSPYVILEEPPSDYPKLRRARHPLYEFRPLTGYERPTL